MNSELVLGPVQFAEHGLGLKLPVVSRVALRQLVAPTNGRVSVSKSRFKIAEIRKIEIAAALWHMMTRPEHDVVVVLPFVACRDAWLADMTTVLKQASPRLQQDAAVYNGGVITRFLGPGKLRFWIAKGRDVHHPTEIIGDRAFAIITDFDNVPTRQLNEILKRFAPPGTVLVTTYAD